MAEESTAVAEAMKSIADQIAAGIAAGINEARPKKISIGQFEAKTPWHANKRTATKLKMAWYQNGARVPDKRTSAKEIALFNQIHRSGRYINRIIEVIVRDEGSEKVGELRYKNKTVDDRMAFRGEIRDLADMLQKIVDEQTALDEADGIVQQERQSFNSKATQVARAAAATKQ